MKDIMCRVSKQLSKEESENIHTIKGLGNGFHDFLEALPNNRGLSLAKTKLEEAVMWAVKDICAAE